MRLPANATGTRFEVLALAIAQRFARVTTVGSRTHGGIGMDAMKDAARISVCTPPSAKKDTCMRQLLAATTLALLALPAVAQEPNEIHIGTPEGAPAPEASPDCSQGVVYDDGEFVDFYGVRPAYVVMKFDLPSGTTALDQVCSCLARLDAGSPAALAYNVIVFDDNGSGGSPGTFLGSVPATANNIPVVGNYDFYNVSLAGSGIALPDTSVYVGVQYDSARHLVCGDRSATTTQRNVFHSGNGTVWVNSAMAFSDSGPRAWGPRVDPATAPTACVPTDEVVCLNAGRFKVQATYATATLGSGNAHAVRVTSDTGYFWFFNSTNVEAVVKVLDGCSYNGRFWYFAGGLTNVETVITVTDTRTGAIRSYTNPQGAPFQPIQDTSAFSSCP